MRAAFPRFRRSSGPGGPTPGETRVPLDGLVPRPGAQCQEVRGWDRHAGRPGGARQDRDLTDLGKLGHDARLGVVSSKSSGKDASNFSRSWRSSRSFMTRAKTIAWSGCLGSMTIPWLTVILPVARLAARRLLQEGVDAFSGMTADDVRHDQDPVQVRVIEQLADVLLIGRAGLHLGVVVQRRHQVDFRFRALGGFVDIRPPGPFTLRDERSRFRTLGGGQRTCVHHGSPNGGWPL